MENGTQQVYAHYLLATHIEPVQKHIFMYVAATCGEIFLPFSKGGRNSPMFQNDMVIKDN